MQSNNLQQAFFQIIKQCCGLDGLPDFYPKGVWQIVNHDVSVEFFLYPLEFSFKGGGHLFWKVKMGTIRTPPPRVGESILPGFKNKCDAVSKACEAGEISLLIDNFLFNVCFKPQ